MGLAVNTVFLRIDGARFHVRTFRVAFIGSDIWIKEYRVILAPAVPIAPRANF